MKKNYFLALILMTGFASSAIAQTAQSDDGVISGKAQVVAAVTVTGVNALQFGMVTKGVAKTISTTGTVLQGNTGTSVTMGSEQNGTFTITKGVNTLVTLQLTSLGYLLNGTTQLPINFADYGLNKMALLTGATNVAFTPTSPLVIQSTGDYANYYAAGSFGVSLGGTVVPILTQEEGDYTGNITLTATYN